MDAFCIYKSPGSCLHVPHSTSLLQNMPVTPHRSSLLISQPPRLQPTTDLPILFPSPSLPYLHPPPNLPSTYTLTPNIRSFITNATATAFTNRDLGISSNPCPTLPIFSTPPFIRCRIFLAKIARLLVYCVPLITIGTTTTTTRNLRY